jgi:hypothetical protein
VQFRQKNHFRFAFICIAIVASLAIIYAVRGQRQIAEIQRPESVDDLPSQAGSLDFAFLRLNMAIPSFAGMYWEKGVLKVHLRDVSDAEAARPHILKFLRDNYYTDKENDPPKIEFLPAKTPFTWFDIYHFKEALRDVFTIHDTVFLDADESCGCVTVGISSERARPLVENFVKLAQVPADGVRIQYAAPVTPWQNVTGQFRPMVGGIQIKNDDGPFAFLGAGIGDTCTMTIVGTRFGIAGIITASHCTRVQGGVEATSFYQNGKNLFGVDYVAHESADPVWIAGTPGCPAGSLCRSSDSAFAVVDIGNQNAALASIARPDTLCLSPAIPASSTPCSLNLPSLTSMLTVTSTAGPPMMGATVTKVGRSTGWTGGPVTSTCVTVTSLPPFSLLCATFATVGGTFGDSGAPVFTIPAGAGATATTATLVGLTVGGSSTPTSSTMFFSPIGAVVSDLSPLALFPPAVTPGQPGSPPSPCVTGCGEARNACMKLVGRHGGPRPSDCVADYHECLNECRHPQH